MTKLIELKIALFLLLTLLFCACENPQNFDSVTPPDLPPNWTTTGVDGQKWITVADSTIDRPSDTSPNSAFVPAFNNQDVSLTSPLIFLINGGSSELSFQHRCKTESGFDGMILEAAINGAGFANIDTIGTFLEGPYTDIFPLLGINKAWSGEANYVLTRIAMPYLAPNTVLQFRFRSISDAIISGTGCSLDSLYFKGADLQVSTVASKDLLSVNEELTYTITVKNIGPLQAANFQITNILPTDFILSSTNLSQGTFTVSTAPVLSANLGNLAVNGEATITIVGKVANFPATAALLQLHVIDFLRNVAAAGADFGPALPQTGSKVSVMLANDGSGDTEDACQPFPVGNITPGFSVLIRQSNNCSFNQQVKNAELGGAAAAIIFNSTDDQLVTMGSTGIPVSIPAVFVGAKDGLYIRGNAGILKTALVSVSNTLVNEVITTSSVFEPNMDNNFSTKLTNVRGPQVELKIMAEKLLAALSALKPLKSNATSAQKEAHKQTKINLRKALKALRKMIKTSGAGITLLDNSIPLNKHSTKIKSAVSLSLKLQSSFARDKRKATRRIRKLIELL